MKRAKRYPPAVSRLCGEETAARSPILRKYSGRCPLFLRGEGEGLRLEGTHSGAVRCLEGAQKLPDDEKAEGNPLPERQGASPLPHLEPESGLMQNRALPPAVVHSGGLSGCSGDAESTVTPEPKCAGAGNHSAAGRASFWAPCWKRAALRLPPALTVNLYTHTVGSVSLESP